MEEVRDTYQRDFAEDEVWVCRDETRRQQTKETRLPRPVRPGQPEIVDYEYERNGTAHLFLAFAPNENWRTVNVTDRRTARDGAQFIRELADDPIPGKKIVRVMDHRNTHSPASLYEAFAPREAMRVRKRFEFRYPPKHGSWLHRAEIEIGAWSRPCLRRRIPDRATLLRETAAWVKRRNAAGGTVDWRFTTADARVKLKSLYPSIQ